ncbi:hypothetical protein [Serratia proteamaculans]|uniref:hypothetical protein n=1 Tax=Serratia proteamaculans TaxID=28151 RepID=UPI00217B6B93|nr:hypothetical protein [Serratia proteamaculans]CAI1574015.1 Uncharacterised protein [Serratia proteamaculans]
MNDKRPKPTEDEVQQLKELLEKHPTFVFQLLNKWMNQDGFMLSIRTIEEGNITQGY